MADLTFQHLDAEGDYIICRGHILIASAAEEAVKSKKTWMCLFKPKQEQYILSFLHTLILNLKSVFSIQICSGWNKISSVIFVVKSPQQKLKDMAS